jgi:hypothetical protein
MRTSFDFSPLFRSGVDVVNVVAGVALALSPWYLGYASESQAAWNAWLAGAAIALIAVAAILAYNQYEEWANLALGLWTILSPWLLGFSALSSATVLHVVVGIVVAVLAAGRLWTTSDKPYSTA